MSNPVHALFIGWNRSVSGREKNAIEIFQGFTNYLHSLETKKQIVSFEPVLLNAHGGDMNGFIVVRANRDDLNKLTVSEDWLNWITQASYSLTNFGVVEAFLGDEIQTRMTRYAKLAK